MRIDLDDRDKTYKRCMSTGMFKEKFADVELIRSLQDVAERGLDFIARTSRNLPIVRIGRLFSGIITSPCEGS